MCTTSLVDYRRFLTRYPVNIFLFSVSTDRADLTESILKFIVGDRAGLVSGGGVNWRHEYGNSSAELAAAHTRPVGRTACEFIYFTFVYSPISRARVYRVVLFSPLFLVNAAYARIIIYANRPAKWAKIRRRRKKKRSELTCFPPPL